MNISFKTIPRLLIILCCTPLLLTACLASSSPCGNQSVQQSLLRYLSIAYHDSVRGTVLPDGITIADMPSQQIAAKPDRFVCRGTIHIKGRPKALFRLGTGGSTSLTNFLVDDISAILASRGPPDYDLVSNNIRQLVPSINNHQLVVHLPVIYAVSPGRHELMGAKLKKAYMDLLMPQIVSIVAALNKQKARKRQQRLQAKARRLGFDDFATFKQARSLRQTVLHGQRKIASLRHKSQSLNKQLKQVNQHIESQQALIAEWARRVDAFVNKLHGSFSFAGSDYIALKSIDLVVKPNGLFDETTIILHTRLTNKTSHYLNSVELGIVMWSNKTGDFVVTDYMSFQEQGGLAPGDSIRITSYLGGLLNRDSLLKSPNFIHASKRGAVLYLVLFENGLMQTVDAQAWHDPRAVLDEARQDLAALSAHRQHLKDQLATVKAHINSIEKRVHKARATLNTIGPDKTPDFNIALD